MARNTSQGAGARQGTSRSPVSAPSPASALEDRIALLEEALNDGRQNMGSMKKEMASMQRVYVRGREISEYVKVRELDELHRTVETLRRRIDVRDSEVVGTPSQEEKQPIPMYYGKRKDL